MQRVQSCIVVGKKNVNLILSIIMLLFLCAISVWDVAIITRDYIFNNRNTLVKIQNVKDTFPFLDNDPARLCMIYDNKTIFSELWKENNTETAAYFMENLKLARQIFENNADIKDANIVGQEKPFNVPVAAGIIMIALQRMDRNMIDRLYNKPYDTLVPSEYSILDPLLANVSHTDKLQALWLQRQESMIQYRDPDIRAVIPLQYLDLDKICVGLPLSSVLFPNQQGDVVFSTGVVGEENFVFNNSEVTVTMELYHGSGNVYTPNPLSNIDVFISNSGVFQKKLTTKCSEEPAIEFPFTSISIGCEAQYVRIFTEKCQCVPFTYQNQFYAIDISNQNLPFCSSAMYNECFALVKQSKCLPPCTVIKNNYFVRTTNEFLGESYCFIGDNYTLCQARRLLFQCTDSVYAIYEERFKLSLAQFVSLIGGDLGLYTGISLWGVWQFFSLACSFCLMYRTVPVIGDRAPLKAATKKMLLNWLGHFAEDTTEMSSICSNDIQQISRTSDVSSWLNQSVAKLDASEEAISDLKKLIDELFQMIASNHESTANRSNWMEDETVSYM